jgi:LysM repeat protein
MKKIIEAELKNCVNSLREYVTSLDEQATINPKRVTLNPDGTTSGGIAPAPAVTADPGVQVPTPAVATAVAPYVVKQGDNLTRIARSMGVTLQDLLKANPQFQANGRNINLIYPGEPVNRPSATAPAPAAPVVPKEPPMQGKRAPDQAKSARTLTYPDRELTPDEKTKYGISSPAVRESVSYADDQTLARIVSLGRR